MNIIDMLLCVQWQDPLVSSFQQPFVTRQARGATTVKCHADKSLLLNLPIMQGRTIDPILVVTVKCSQSVNSG